MIKQMALSAFVLLAGGIGAASCRGDKGIASGDTTQESVDQQLVPKWIPGDQEAPLGYCDAGIAPKLKRGAIWKVSGWAVDLQEGAPVAGVIVQIDDTDHPASLGFPRRDVRDTLGRQDTLKSGWVAEIDSKSIPPGTHRFKVVALDSQKHVGRLLCELEGVEVVP